MSKRKLGDLVGQIDMSAFQKRESGNAGAFLPARPQTGVGLVMGAIAGKSDLERKLAESQEGLDQANQRLAEYDGIEVVRKLDPATIRRSCWANRNELNFIGPEWEKFKAEIKSAKGNIEPIKVRRVFDRQTPPTKNEEEAGHEFEIVYGHRRHQACLELSLPVSTLVVNSMEDRALFAEMDRENRNRESLSAWEQGRMYNHALREGLYPSLRRLADELGVNLSDASRCCKLAQLPDAVIAAFPSPLVIQVRWAKSLADALQSDPDGMLERAHYLQLERGKFTPIEVIEQLLNRPEKGQKVSVPIHVHGQVGALLKIGPRDKIILEFKTGLLDPARYDALVNLIADFLSVE